MNSVLYGQVREASNGRSLKEGEADMTGNPTKVRIDLSRGLVEMEGDEEFVQRSLQDVKEILSGLMNKTRPMPITIVDDAEAGDTVDVQQQLIPGFEPTMPRSVALEITSEELRTFIEPLGLADSEIDHVTAFSYYLAIKRGWQKVSYDDLEECYRLIGRPVPQISKAVNNASFKKRYLSNDRAKGILVTREGRNFIEHPESRAAARRRTNKSGERESTNKKGMPTAPVPRIKGDLDLYGTKGNTPFKDFSDGKHPNSNVEKVAIVAYYITQVLGQDTFDEGDVFTCFEHMKWKPMLFLRNNIINHKNQHGYYSFAESGGFQITLRLKNFVEHTLPHQSGSVHQGQ
jgi:hypothetical protein